MIFHKIIYKSFYLLLLSCSSFIIFIFVKNVIGFHEENKGNIYGDKLKSIIME